MAAVWLGVLMGGGMLAWSTGSAQQADPLESARACAGMADPRARLSCYDALFPPTASRQEVARVAERDFGLEASKPRSLDGAQTPGQIEAIVTRVTGEPGSGRLFTLENGQVWRQTDSGVLGQVRPGDRVVIKDAAFSSYLLLTPSRVSVRVKRVQ